MGAGNTAIHYIICPYIEYWLSSTGLVTQPYKVLFQIVYGSVAMQVLLTFMTDDGLFAIHLAYAYKRHSYRIIAIKIYIERLQFSSIKDKKLVTKARNQIFLTS